jgi:hypothetical protein
MSWGGGNHATDFDGGCVVLHGDRCSQRGEMSASVRTVSRCCDTACELVHLIVAQLRVRSWAT